MPGVASINSVTTADKAPTAAPYTVSKKAGKKVATVSITWSGVDAQSLYFAALMLGTTTQSPSKPLARYGLMCGVGQRCGPTARSFRADPYQTYPTQQDPQGHFYQASLSKNVDVSADLIEGADGDYPVTGFAALIEQA